MKFFLSTITVLCLFCFPLLIFAQVNPKVDNFWVAFDEYGMIIPSESGGTMDDPLEDGTWYEYTEWWNIWFYDDPFDVDRYKEIYMEFYIYPLDPELPTYVEIVANWSTQFWEQGGLPPLPPMTLDEENIVITRSETIYLFEDMLGPGEFIFYQMPSNLIIPWYNPEWVSVDIRGTNFQILPPDAVPGQWSEIVHWCLPKVPPGPDVEMGDAPEGVMAYIPSTLGLFPTCLLCGTPVSFISHTMPINAWFGGYVDIELDGNAGSCSPYVLPYDQDECGNNPTFDITLDEGLMHPSPYTIIGSSGYETYHPCSGVNDTLGPPCDSVTWGQDIDIWIQATTSVYLNVLFDWDQDGDWGGTSNCPSFNVNEHVLNNFVIPAVTNGPLSGVPGIIPDFKTGPNEGYVWVRFSLTDQPVPFDWDGHGVFGDGETEDYLLLIATPLPPIPDNVDMGDAPEDDEDGVDDALAYIPSTLGHFPTCVNSGPPTSYISHIHGTAWFGGMVDSEGDGNSGICNPYTFPYNNDEFGTFPYPILPPSTLDEGLMFPSPYTIVGSSGSETYQPCSGVTDTLAPPCTGVTWGQDIDIWINTGVDIYLNVLFDWDMDGDWGGTSTCPSMTTTDEHIIQNFVVPAGTIGPLSGIPGINPDFLTGPNEGYVWARFSLTEEPVPIDWDGHGQFLNGETEDYLLLIATPEEPVPLDTLVQNVTIISNQEECYNATNNIVVAGSGTSVDIMYGGEAIFIAGNKILFEPGFTAHTGCYVHGYITESGDYCSALPPFAAAQYPTEEEIREEEVVTYNKLLVDKDINVDLYPNPTSGLFTIDFKNILTTSDILLLNFQGNLAYESRCNNQSKKVIDIRHLSGGMYIVVIKSQNDIFIKKIIKN